MKEMKEKDIRYYIYPECIPKVEENSSTAQISQSARSETLLLEDLVEIYRIAT